MTESRTSDFHATLFVPISTSVEAVFKEVVQLLIELDDILGPFDLRLGEDGPIGPSVRSTDVSNFTGSPSGFMAMSKTATADVTKDRPPQSPDPDGVKVSLFLRGPSDAVVACMLEVLVRWSTRSAVTCAWAGSAEEVRHHLFARLDLPRGSVEAYVGRNHRKLVPGLFWWNYWSLDWLASREVGLDRLPTSWAASTSEAPHAHAVVVASFPWRQWQQHVEAAESWVDETAGVFSIRKMMALKPESLSELSALRFIRQWK